MPIRSLRHNRAHDYKFLMRRWRAVAAVTDLRIKKYSEAGGCNLYCLASGRKKTDAPSVYLSAGIHGDEAAATEGLIEWAQANTNILRNLNALVFPCLNPWGLGEQFTPRPRRARSQSQLPYLRRPADRRPDAVDYRVRLRPRSQFA